METKRKPGRAEAPALALLSNETLPAAEAAGRAVRRAARRLGIRLLAEADAARAEALLVLGGDGTMLRAVRAHAALGKPFFGVNAGSLGYLTATPVEGVEDALRAWRDGETALEERSLLRACVRRDGAAAPGRPVHALNDLVLSREGTGRVVALDLEVDGRPVSGFLCDGFVLATPTGSTAYSLSAGGPILSPRTAAVVATVICPHALGTRPLVLPADCEVVVRVARAESPVSFSADGRVAGRLARGDALVATTAGRSVRLVVLPGADPFGPLRRKLGWSGTVLPR